MNKKILLIFMIATGVLGTIGGATFVNAATNGSGALSLGVPIHSISQVTQSITQLADATILQLNMSQGETKPPLVIKNSNGDNVFTIFADGSAKFGAHSITLNPNSGEVTGAKISTSDITGKINQGQINDKAVGHDQLGDKAVGQDKLDDKAVGHDQLGDKAVGQDKINDKAVGHDQLGDKAVGGNNIADQAITPDKIFPFTDGIPITEFNTPLLGDSSAFIFYPVNNQLAQSNIGNPFPTCLESKPAGTTILLMIGDVSTFPFSSPSQCNSGSFVDYSAVYSSPTLLAKGDVIVLTSDGNHWQAVTKINTIQVKAPTPHVITPANFQGQPMPVSLGSYKTFVVVGTNIQPLDCLENKPMGTSISLLFADPSPSTGFGCGPSGEPIILQPNNPISSGQTLILTSDGTTWNEVYRH